MRNQYVQPMQIYLFTGGVQSQELQELGKRLSEALPNLTMLTKLSDALVSAAPGHNPVQNLTYIIVPFLDTASTLDRVISIVEQDHLGTFFIFISKEISASEYKRLTRTGGADWVSLDYAPQEILDVLSRRSSLQPSASGARQTKLDIIGFVPSSGGVGNTTLALETAIQLKLAKRTRHRRICLLDLDVQTSHVCDYLDIEPRLKMDEISKNPERLDDQLFGLFISSHSSGLDVLAGPRQRGATVDLKIAALDALFRMIATRYDLLVIDLPPLWFEWTAQVLSVCDLAILTGLNTVPGLRQISGTLEAVRAIESPPKQVMVALGRCQTTLLGRIARRHHARRVLGEENVLYIREDPATAAQGVNTGIPLSIAAPSSRVSKDVRALVNFVSGMMTATTQAQKTGVNQTGQSGAAVN
jgi:pilus assembly protein CpaE